MTLTDGEAYFLINNAQQQQQFKSRASTDCVKINRDVLKRGGVNILCASPFARPKQELVVTSTKLVEPPVISVSPS